MSETKIVYTPWENLKKTADMVVGQIGYHNHKRCKVYIFKSHRWYYLFLQYITVKKNNDIVKKIEKTRSEDMKPDLQAERLARDAEVLAEQKAKAKDAAEKEKAFKLQCEKERYEKSYDRLFEDDPPATTNNDSDNDSDDFMWDWRWFIFPAWIVLIALVQFMSNSRNVH